MADSIIMSKRGKSRTSMSMRRVRQLGRYTGWQVPPVNSSTTLPITFCLQSHDMKDIDSSRMKETGGRMLWDSLLMLTGNLMTRSRTS